MASKDADFTAAAAACASAVCSIYQKRVSGNPRVFAVGSCCVYKINANEQEQSRIFI